MILEKDEAAVNDEDNDSQTALHLACVHGKYDVVELLLDKGGTFTCDSRRVGIDYTVTEGCQ